MRFMLHRLWCHDACLVSSRAYLFTLQAATCGRCRSELGEAGRVCRHCRLDDVWVGWEARLFRLESRAMGAGGHVSHEDALRQVSPGPPWATNSNPVSIPGHVSYEDALCQVSMGPPWATKLKSCFYTWPCLP